MYPHRTRPTVVAEIGCNHMGQMETARELIKVAKIFCEADYVKFQKRNPRELLTPEQYNAPHPNPYHSYGRTYGEHREFLELSKTQHRELAQFCRELGIGYATSVWDLASAKEIVELNPVFIKIPSACNTNFEMLSYLCDEYAGDIHLSLGMTTREEEMRTVSFFAQRKRSKNLVLYACTSGYPVDHADVCLYEISRLIDTYGREVKEIGFSGHHKGIALDVAAFVLGATWIERHFTLDRTWKGTDHAASLEPDGLRRLIRDLAGTAKALSAKGQEILPVEVPQREKLKRGDSEAFLSSAKRVRSGGK
ncbi:MAG: N-acetylneuraminate synthase family protein [Oligoflexia bacterium]|nr:N-acetylneuraminate synthase family protein [Oligoflexia bacterium]